MVGKEDETSSSITGTVQVISTFANNVPVHFRAPALLGLVWLLWGFNVWVFGRYGIDYCELLGFNRSTALSAQQIIRSALIYLGLLFLGFALIWEAPLSDVLIWPSIFYMGGFLLFLLPVDIFHRSGRERLLFNFYRVCVPSSKGVAFVEVLLGDVMTSLCKVFADMEVTGCVILAHMAARPEVVGSLRGATLHTGTSGVDGKDLSLYGCSDSWMRPLVTSVPFLLRFQQCIRAYFVTRDRKNLVNSAKYVSSLPVIWISAFTHHFPDHAWTETLKVVWVLAVSFNSFFSFMWDIVMDWGFCRNGATHFLLREHLVYRHSLFYYWAIVVDFILRVLWSFKLSVHLSLSAEGHTFLLEVLEVFRRFLWLFLRVEWQAVDTGRIRAPDHGIVRGDAVVVDDGTIKTIARKAKHSEAVPLMDHVGGGDEEELVWSVSKSNEPLRSRTVSKNQHAVGASVARHGSKEDKEHV